MTSLEKSALPAHKVWVDLYTRITSQDLHFRSGREETALESIVDVFRSTRALMKDAIGADEFLQLADVLLKTVRPYTARWHVLIDTNKQFVGPAARLQFRSELIELQSRLAQLQPLFESLSHGKAVQIPPEPRTRSANLGMPVPMGIDESPSRPMNAENINRYERGHVAKRRGTPLLRKDERLNDGAGLALSGGGIRSATFCLGVAQVLAEKKLLDRFDYLSTVSGGGYFGSFLSNQFTNTPPAANSLEKLLDPRTEESDPVRHLRNSSKYLLPKTTFQRLMLAGQLFSGTLATTLLTAAVPVAAAFLLRLIVIHFFGFAERVCNAFVGAALVAGLLAAACWLIRPVKRLPESARGVLDMVSAVFCSIAVAALTVVLTWWATHYKPGGWQHWHFAGFSLAGLATLISGAVVIKALQAAWKYRKALSRLFMFSGVVLFIVVYLWTVEALGLQPAGWTTTVPEQWVFGGLVLWALWALSVNLNETGLHRYYRDKLAECYLNAQSNSRTVPNPPPLTQLSEELPYHLINTTVNLTSSKNPELRGRGGDFFLLSKFFCGSPLMQYKSTQEVTSANPDLDLATAMAISGAAASTNMGWQTMHEYRALMAIFNVRLGYWMKWQRQKSILTSNAFVELLAEIIGRLKETTTSINLSDGGHIENLAVYELIRRKTRFIVCVDGGLDAEMTCVDLNRLQRLVAIDFDYRLEFDAAGLKLQPKYSSAYGVLVKIDYTPNQRLQNSKELGWMLYVKLAVVGTEASYVLDYQRENPVFPHQTTLDQFFDEAQFEAYRKLGEAAARSFFAAPFGEPTPADINNGLGFESWFQRLAQNLLRDTDPVFGP